MKLQSTGNKIFSSGVDWLLVLFILPILGAGLITMNSFMGESYLFNHQLIWIGISFSVMLLFSFLDFRFLKRTDLLVSLYLLFIVLLVMLFLFGHTSGGAQSWFDFGSFSFQPSDMMKIVLILMLAKYFSRRHIEIGNIKHIFISGLYAFIPFVLIFLQPDFGSAITIFFIWFGLALVSGISKKHLILILGLILVSFAFLWGFVFQPYQKARIINFVEPLSDIRGTGYNVYQSTIAVGSGQLLGKGVGFGTQSRLKFLPEYETDFIFAAFAEEFGLLGNIVLLLTFLFLIYRILWIAAHARGLFERLLAAAIGMTFFTYAFVNMGMVSGILPVVGVPLPFISYGGTAMITLGLALGIVFSIGRYTRLQTGSGRL